METATGIIDIASGRYESVKLHLLSNGNFFYGGNP